MSVKVPLKEDRFPVHPPYGFSLVTCLVFGAATFLVGYMVGKQLWRTQHAQEVQSITEHVINAKAELEAGNRNACSDELTRITEDFRKLY